MRWVVNVPPVTTTPLALLNIELGFSSKGLDSLSWWKESHHHDTKPIINIQQQHSRRLYCNVSQDFYPLHPNITRKLSYESSKGSIILCLMKLAGAADLLFIIAFGRHRNPRLCSFDMVLTCFWPARKALLFPCTHHVV